MFIYSNLIMYTYFLPYLCPPLASETKDAMPYFIFSQISMFKIELNTSISIFMIINIFLLYLYPKISRRTLETP